ncbi:MAG: hypothetical protein IJM92_14720 [Fibrobacter sp.]|uniref:type IV pilus biogenesis protein PilM n=1 Tax=Fibrobacter sp. TaxID=35828 RepID=UPI0025C3AF66|nr:hypothetical protein [Fibrobacter sp.]MBQ7080873.1 hypothetical protein [Fibrobacter sp.]
MSESKLYLGVEVGDHYMKVALVDSSAKKVVKLAVLPVECNPIYDIFLFESTLQQWIDENQVKDIVATSVTVPAKMSIIRKVYIPSEAASNKEQYLKWYMELFTNAGVDAYIVDSMTLSGDDSLGYNELVMAVRKEWVDALRKGFRSRGLAPKSLEVDVLSLMNVMDVGEKIKDAVCVVKADFDGVTIAWMRRDELLALRCVSTLSMVGKTADAAYPILADEVVEQMKLAESENGVNGVTDVRLCGEMASEDSFVELLMGKLGNYDVSLLRSLTQLPSDDGVDPVNMVYCVGAVGAALNQMEGV